MPRMRTSFGDCFEVTDGGCWRWMLSLLRNGYGRGSYRGRRGLAHRLVYEHYRGEIPAGLDLDHLCRNRWCVNPSHLEPVTRSENLRRGVGLVPQRARQTHCHAGHPFNEVNTYWAVRKGGRRERHCRRCRAAAEARRRLKLKRAVGA